MLASFLEHPDRPEGTLHYHQLQGFLFAVVSCPEPVRPSEWLPIVFGEGSAGYKTLEEAEAVLGELMTLYNAINATAMEDRAVLPADCAFRSSALDNLEEDAPIAQWSRGFVLGHDWLEDVWDHYTPEEYDEDVGLMLLTLSFFASKNLARAYLEETGRKDLRKMAVQIVKLFPDAMAKYAHLGRSLAKVVMEHHAAKPTPVRSVKIGRNAPCPCGSGKKYKMCCGSGRVQ